MALARVLAAWAAVTLWFLAWHGTAHRVRREPGPALKALGSAVRALALEALLLTLFAGLWFASLGAGNWLLLFGTLALLLELAPLTRSGSLAALRWKPLAGGILRVVAAGLVLSLLLG